MENEECDQELEIKIIKIEVCGVVTCICAKRI